MLLPLICAGSLAAEETAWSLHVDDYYPTEEKELATEIEGVMREHLRAVEARDVGAVLATVNRLKKEEAEAFWNEAFAQHDSVKTSIMEATWLGKDSYFNYVRVLLLAETVEPKTLETQIWVFSRDNGSQTILTQFIVFSLPLAEAGDKKMAK